MAREYPSVLELVGNTPIVRLAALGRGVQPRLLAKLEYLNPGGSKRDAEVVEAVRAAGGTLVLTGRRHFRH